MRISDWSSDVCSSDLRTVLFTTRGFRDALRIGYQERPRLFDLRIVLSELLYERIDEVNERVDAQGKVLRAPDRSEEHTSELQSLMRISYAVFCLKKKTKLKHKYHKTVREKH